MASISVGNRIIPTNVGDLTNSLDYTLKTGGLPRGHITEIFGPEGVGKTTLALKIIASVQQQGFLTALIDTQQATDPNRAISLGVDLDSLILSQVQSEEEIVSLFLFLIQTGVDLIVIDSAAGLPTEYLAKLVRNIEQNEPHACILLTNQVRTKLQYAGVGNTDTVSGRSVLTKAASIRISLQRSRARNKKHIVKTLVVKNRLAPVDMIEGEFTI